MDLKEKLKSLFRRNEKTTVPLKWAQDPEEERPRIHIQEERPRNIRVMGPVSVGELPRVEHVDVKGKSKWRLPGLRRVKVILAWILLLFNVFTGWSVWSVNQGMSWVFFLTALILLDYVNKARDTFSWKKKEAEAPGS